MAKDSSNQIAPEALAALATRAAIREQPTFRDLSSSEEGELVEALHVCTWCGFAAFLSSPSFLERLYLCVDKAISIAESKRGIGPEVLAARIVQQFMRPQHVRIPTLNVSMVMAAADDVRPERLSRAAVQATRYDLDLLEKMGDVYALGKAPLWPQGSAPSEWESILNEWRNMLGRYGLTGLIENHLQMLPHVLAGGFDWKTPYRWIDDWGRRHDVPLSEAPSKKTSAKAAPSQKQTSPVPFDLGQYDLSEGASNILNGAAAGMRSDAVSTSAVLLEMIQQGRPGSDPQWIADFVRQAITAQPTKYQEAIAKYLGDRIERQRVPAGKGDSRKSTASMMMPGLAWSLGRAKEIAVLTTGVATIRGRHLLAGLILDPPEPYTLGAHRILEEIGIDVPLLRQRLYEWVRGYGDNEETWRATLVGTAAALRRRAEFDADCASGPDLLDIESDVTALATLIAARDASPPLSIGLFGDWGSGKTFFMRQLRRAVAQLSKEARDAQVMQRELPFYKRIIQIEFNAWHYVEGNLWASMVEHILDNLHISDLNISDEQKATVTEELQQHWIGRLGYTQKQVADADQKKKEAATKVIDAENAVKAAEAVHEAKKQELQQLSKKSAARDFKLSGSYDAIVQALGPLGFKPLSDAVTELHSSLREARSVVERGNTALTPLLYAEDRKNRWRSLLIILVGAPLGAGVVGLIISALGTPQVAQISALATGAAGLLGWGAKWLREQADWMSKRVAQVEQGQRIYDEALAKELAKTAEQTAKTEQELAFVRQEYTLAQQRAEEARRENAAAVADLADATTSRLLGRFIQDRAASTDYRKHLGVLAIVRQDFQKLSELIEEENWRLAPDGPNDRLFPRLKKITSLDEEARDADTRINRIVLYIDDLDRCPPAKVVDVLQAVHLLLAFPLFVVVVGVDARWISRSLETRYRELLHVGGADAAVDITQMFGVARSEDYLEKIFQIPLWLRAMNANSARKMVQGLLRNENGASLELKSGQGQPDVAADGGIPPLSHDAEPSNPVGAAGQADVPSGGASSGTAAPAAPETTTTAPPQTPIIPNLESLNVRDFERSAIDDLSPLLGRSPRALKRFVNLYRLIKAGLTLAEHNAFIRQDEHVLGDYEAVLFLLAVDTGLPRVSKAMFDALLATNLDPDTDKVNVKQLIEALDKHPSAHTSDWAKLKAWMVVRRESRRFNQGIVRLASWVPRVSRYSFQAAHLEGSWVTPSPRKGARKTSAP